MTVPQRTSPTYPTGQSGALCLTFDLDGHTMWTSKDPHNAERPSVLSSGSYDVGLGLDLVLETLDAHGVRTTFFVPLDVAAAEAGAVERIVAAGHEIAMHGTDHNALQDRSRPGELQLLRDLKDSLEQLCGTPIRGYRAPLYDVTEQTRDILAEIGCTFSSNYMDSVHPYVVASRSGRVCELPVHWMLDDGPYLLFANNPANHRQFMTNQQISEVWTPELLAIHALGGAAVFTLHPQLIGRPSRLQLLVGLLQAAEDMGGVWFPTMGEIAAMQLDPGVRDE